MRTFLIYPLYHNRSGLSIGRNQKTKIFTERNMINEKDEQNKEQTALAVKEPTQNPNAVTMWNDAS